MKHFGKKAMALTLASAMVIAYTPAAPASAASGVSTKQYTLSKKAGTYSKAITVTVKAKKGFKVYYSTGSGNLTVKKLIKSGKKKSVKIKKTTKLKLYAVKSTQKLTNKQLKSKAVKKKTKTYTYKIKTAGTSASSAPSASPASTASSGALASASPAPGGTTAAPTNTSGTEETGTGGNTGTDATNAPVTFTLAPDDQSSGTTTPTPVPTEGPKTTKDPDANTILVSLGDTVETENDTDDSITVTEAAAEDEETTVTINSTGYYEFTGSASNLEIEVSNDVQDAVWISLKDVSIDNSALNCGDPVINLGKKKANAKSVVISLEGDNTIIGPSDFTEEPAGALISSKLEEATVTLTSEGDATLTVTDSMDPDKEYGTDADGEEIDPSDGISAKGTLIIESGTYNINVNGDCLKGTGAVDDNDAYISGGVNIYDGTVNLTSNQGSGIKSKEGIVNILGGTINCKYTASDAVNAKNNTVNISGGTLKADQCYGDGIQGEEVNISGGTVDIKTYYEYAGKNFYDTSLGEGNYNKLTKSGGMGGGFGGASGSETKTETVNVDTGSHKGIKAGTKEKSYSYTTVSEGSDLTAGELYTQESSGGLTITGGDITIDTTGTGIKYNSSQGDANAACEDQCIIGAPEDGLKSNNDCTITGGNITISAADDGISCEGKLTITDSAKVDIKTAYEGIESGTIVVGTKDSETGPVVSVYTNDDGINAAKKTDVTYTYTDETEEKYVKTSTAGSGNTLTIYSGYVNIMIADDKDHEVTLQNGSTEETYKFSADGDGIDCNGGLNIQGGTVVVYGSSKGDNSPIDVETNDGGFTLGAGATVFQAGSSGMSSESIPTSINQAYVTTNTNLSAGTSIAITDESALYVAAVLPKQTSFVMFSSPSLKSGTAYSLYSGGEVSSVLMEDVAHDYRYRGYTGGTVAATLTATTEAGTGGGPGGDMPGGNSGNQGGPGGNSGNQGGPGGMSGGPGSSSGNQTQ